MKSNYPRRVGDLRRLTTMTSVPNATPIRVRLKVDGLRGEVTKEEAAKMEWVVADARYELTSDETETLWLTVKEAD